MDFGAVLEVAILFFGALLVLILVVFYYLGGFAGSDTLGIRGG
jgi:uncharacterized protein (UPF0333 family)